ncbi:MAG: hypothetical protein AABX62_01665 [Thermoproteota archaeon]|jgi:hypothetical protein
MTYKLSISITDELHYAIKLIEITYRMDRSRAIETLLREHPLVKKEIDVVRSEPKHGLLTVSPGFLAKMKKVKKAKEVAATASS